jgi:ribosomal protein L10
MDILFCTIVFYMAITRQKKEQLVQQYVENLQSASNAVVVQQQ